MGYRGLVAAVALIGLLALAFGPQLVDVWRDRVETPGSTDAAVPQVDVRSYDDEPQRADEVAQVLVGLDSVDDLAAITDEETLALVEGGQPGALPAEALPAGARVVPDPTTWERVGRIAVMEVDVITDGGNRDRFEAWIIEQDEGEWRLSHTTSMPENAP